MANTSSISGVLARLEAADVESLGVAELATAMTRVRQVQGFLAGLETRLARRAHHLHHEQGAAPASDVLARHGRRSRREAERVASRAGVLGDTPELEGALGEGRIGVEHADVVAAAAKHLTDEQRRTLLGRDAELTDAAIASTPEEFRRRVRDHVDQITADGGLGRDERQRAARHVRLGVDKVTGMGWIRGELHPEAYHRLKRALIGRACRPGAGAPRSESNRGQLLADALVDLATRPDSTAGGGTPGRMFSNRAEIVVVTPLATLTGADTSRPAEHLDGSPMPVAALRRLACDAGLIPVVLDGAGRPIDVGRSRRLATADQRAALAAVYATCAVPGCDVPFDDCEIHHLAEWTDDLGPTDLANLVPACAADHHRVHEGGWRLALDPVDRTLTVYLPDGTVHCRGRPDRQRAPDRPVVASA